LETGGGGEAPGHGGGVVGEAETAVGTEEDNAAVAAETVEEIRDGFAGGEFGGGTASDAVGGPFAEDELHDGFAPAGERDGGGEIVGIAAATDEGGVADAAGSLVESATGGGSGGEIAAGIESDGADGVVTGETGGVVNNCCLRALVVVEDRKQRRIQAGECVVTEASRFAELSMDEALTLAVEDQLGVVDEGHAVGLGKLLGSSSDEIDVLAVFEDQTGGLNGIAEALDTGHATSLHAATVHEEGIELDASVGGEKAATAGVEGGVIFEDGHGRFDRIDGRSAARKNSIAGFKRFADTGLVGSSRVGGDGPCASVDEQSGSVVGGRGHRNIVEHLARGVCDAMFWEVFVSVRASCQ
jgi:hypothetical protein